MLPGGANPPMSFFLYEGAPVIETYYTDAETTILVGDCLEYLTDPKAGPDLTPDGNIDLVLTSPPYEDCRTYGIGFDLKGEDWVRWAKERYLACYNICHGLTCWVVEGKTKDFRWSATPALLMADLHRAGVGLRKPMAYGRFGIPGSGGPDYLRNDYEFVIAASHGKLPWSDNVACGGEPVCGVGGEMSNRGRGGGRINEKVQTRRKANGDGKYRMPKLANPGNVIWCGAVGGGNCGSELCHETEAPYPESLCEFIIRSFCPPGGTVLDPFCGSGTTLAVARRLDRKAIGIDIRKSQAELSFQRIVEVVAAQKELTHV